MFIYFWKGERSRGAEREGDTEFEAGSKLWAVSTDPDTGVEPTNCEIMTWTKVRRRRLTDWATQAPQKVKILAKMCPPCIYLPSKLENKMCEERASFLLFSMVLPTHRVTNGRQQSRIGAPWVFLEQWRINRSKSFKYCVILNEFWIDIVSLKVHFDIFIFNVFFFSSTPNFNYPSVSPWAKAIKDGWW